MNRLRGFFALVEARGGGEMAARELDAALAGDGPEVRGALRALGIVRDAPAATTWPCGEAGCAREVKSAGVQADGRARLVAVCTRASADEGCEAVELAEEDVAQVAIEVGALRGALRDALRLLPTSRTKRPGLAADDARSLGRETAGEERDVYFVQLARGRAVLEVAAEHAGGGRRAWVLVPTRRGAKRIAEAIAGTAVEGVVASGQVTVQALEDVVGVEDKRVVELPAMARERAARALRLACTTTPLPSPERAANETKRDPAVAASEKSRPGAGPRCAALEGFPPIARWGDVTLFDVGDAGVVGVMVKGARRSRRLSCVDLGLADRERRPIQAFELLLMICEGNGIFGTRRFGTQSNGKRVLSELRTALRNAFGLEGDPFEKYSVREKSWKPKFRASSGAAGDPA